MLCPLLLAWAGLGLILDEAAPKEESHRYLRPGVKGAYEARFAIRNDKDGWSITSTTGDANRQMTVSARYGDMDRLLTAKATWTMEDAETVANVSVKDGKATVQPKEKPAQTFDVGPGVIVTSAPDWSDIFLLCRRYDGKKGGLQTFSGLWIHPSQKAQMLKFTIEREGRDTVNHAGKEVELARYRIQIRGPNPYRAWADPHGVLIKLVPLPEGKGGLIREGWEAAGDHLRSASK